MLASTRSSGSGERPHLPSDPPDREPAHEALLLKELFHELPRTGTTAGRPADFRGWVGAAETGAAALEAALRAGESRPASCGARPGGRRLQHCHARYRNVPQPPLRRTVRNAPVKSYRHEAREAHHHESHRRRAPGCSSAGGKPAQRGPVPLRPSADRLLRLLCRHQRRHDPGRADRRGGGRRRAAPGLGELGLPGGSCAPAGSSGMPSQRRMSRSSRERMSTITRMGMSTSIRPNTWPGITRNPSTTGRARCRRR